MRRLKTIASAIIVALVVITCVDYAASAATGGKFILGQLNKANKVTTLKRTTAGPPLKLTTKSSAHPPLATTGRGKVGNLNADLLDGLDSAALKTVPRVFTRNITTPVSSFELVAAVPVGTYLVSYSAYVESSPDADLGSLDCYVEQNNGGAKRYVGENYFDTGTKRQAAASGAGLVTKTVSTGTIALNCWTEVPFVSYTGEPGTEPVQLVLTPVNAATSSSARYVPEARTAR